MINKEKTFCSFLFDSPTYNWFKYHRLDIKVNDCLTYRGERTVNTERVTVRIPSDKVAILEHLVEDGNYENLSDVVREAIDTFINSKFTPENIAKITIDIPKGNVVELESLVKNGDSVSLDDAIRNAVREYTRARMKTKN